ncbi:MAG: hypothetical protein RBR77_01690 [Thauera sp.]|nr:hypothetical protein [Thauera sp.]
MTSSSEPDAAHHEDGLAVVRFQLGNLQLALEARTVRALHQQAPTADSLAIETLLGLGPAGTGPRQWLRLHAAPDLSLALPAPVELSTLALHTIRPLPRLLAASCRLPGLRALARQEHATAPILLLDPGKALSPRHLPPG